MKSYVLLLAACLPLWYTAFDSAGSLLAQGTTWWRERDDVREGGKKLSDAHSAVKAFDKVNAELRAGALGVGDIPEVKTPEGVIEKSLANGFTPYGKGLATTKAFVEAFRNHGDLAVEGPAAARLLTPWVEKRKSAELKKLEDEINKLIADNQVGPGGKLETKYKECARLPECDTVLMQVAYQKINAGINRDEMRKGSLLVLVLKTTELLEDADDTRAKIDKVYSLLARQDKTKDLVTGRFVLVSKAEDPRAMRVFWPGANYVKGAGDAFLPNEYKAAFIRALEVAREFEAARRLPGPGPSPSPVRVFVIWRSDVTPPSNTRGPALPGVDRIKPTLEWVGPGGEPGNLNPWFDNRVTNRLHSDDYAGDMATEFFILLPE